MSPEPYRPLASSLRRRRVQVFTPASTVVFKIFGCDKNIVEGESYLRADYSISCKTNTHTYYRIYAGFMLMVGGLPVLPIDKGRMCCQR